MEATILLKSVAILSLFYLVYLMAFRKETHFVVRRHFFLIGILSALCLPFVIFETVTYVQLPAMETGLVLNETAEFVPTSFESMDGTTPIDWSYWLWVAYGLGLAFFIGQLLVQLVGLMRIIGRHPKTKLGRYTFVEVNQPCAPFSFFRYIVYNPSLHSREELEMILQHEKVHASQWHTLDLLLANILRMVQWFNPFSWLYKRSMEENLEFIADRETAQQVASLKQYQLALVKASSTYTAPALTTQFYQSFIKKRIIMLNKQSSNKRNILKLGIIVPILCLFLWSFNVQEDIQYLQPEPADKELTQPEAEELAIASELSSTRPEAAASPTKELRTTAPVKERTRVVSTKDIKIKFHKDLTESELKAIKKRFKDELGLDLSYTTVRNDAKEITSINISYSGKGQNGNYSINDEGPIEAFYFFRDEDGDVGFWSESLENRRKERMLYREVEREKRDEERRMLRAEREQEMEERRAEIALYRAEAMSERKAKMANRFYEVDELRGRVAVINGDGDEIEVIEIDDLEDLKDEEGNLFVTAESRGGNIFAYRTDDHDHDDIFVLRDRDRHSSKNAVVIHKHTTDAELLKIKADLMENGVSFKYSKLKRNSNGEITRIKIAVDDNKGSNSTVTAEGKDGGPIKKIVAAY